jgi:L,D-peptidoglycan transpeptidase YkuD (ErfK/YbiS/YcfS/YnhG family)
MANCSKIYDYSLLLNLAVLNIKFGKLSNIFIHTNFTAYHRSYQNIASYYLVVDI